MHYYTKTGEFNMMILDLLGPNLEELFSNCNKQFSLKTVLMAADQMVYYIIYIDRLVDLNTYIQEILFIEILNLIIF